MTLDNDILSSFELLDQILFTRTTNSLETGLFLLKSGYLHLLCQARLTSTLELDSRTDVNESFRHGILIQ